jgi:hypothetical protein
MLLQYKLIHGDSNNGHNAMFSFLRRALMLSRAQPFCDDKLKVHGSILSQGDDEKSTVLCRQGRVFLFCSPDGTPDSP